MEYIYCPTCRGFGRLEKRVCPTCRGRGLYAWVGGYLLYWYKRFSKTELAWLKLKIAVMFLINLALFAFGLLGILALAQSIFHLYYFDKVWNFFTQSKNFLQLIFWISVITDAYLFYRFEKLTERRRKIWPKTTQNLLPPTSDWMTINHLSSKFKINVADSLSDEAKKLILNAWQLAEKMSSAEILPIHLLAAGLTSSQISLVINRLGLNWPKLNEKVARALAVTPKVSGLIDPKISKDSKAVILTAYELACQDKMINVDCLKILEALAAPEGVIKEIFYDLEIGLDEIKNVSVWVKVYEALQKEYHRFRGAARFKPKGAMNRAMTAIATPNLDSFSQDLTQVARYGYLGYCLDREKEYAEILRAIEGGHGSAVLVGQPGVGKTTIINGIARRMTTEDVPSVLRDKRLVSLSLASLVAGASRPGEIEQRLQLLMSEIVRSGNIILFIPNIHNMIGVKTTEGELDISEILADALKKKLFTAIATTTTADYRKYIENKSLGEALQKIEVEEPGKNETIQILEANAASIEGKEQVYFSYGSLTKAIELSVRYISERFLPDKAINLMKEVAIFVRNKRGRQTVVQTEDVAAIVAEKTNIPVTKITEQESQKLLNLEDEIHKRIIGQDEAVEMVASALRRARAELRDNKRPIVNLLFLGPTGVGKTELAKTV
ncbi:MAG: AAA family ATPase, partial [Patescibacteria group bacterium]|nr:AAA family ATPase [Patescibacteria group bacterium]